jgi:MOSC domain-containing protein YiiM
LPDAPKESGRVALIVARGEHGRREQPERIRLEVDGGVPGDAWDRRREPHLEKAIAVMQIDVAELIASGQPLALFGDNLFLSLDLSTENLPPGSRLHVGGAVLQVTPMPHNGCHKFEARFGPHALRFVSKAELRHRNLRGIYLRTVEGGEVASGDPVRVTERAPSPP